MGKYFLVVVFLFLHVGLFSLCTVYFTPRDDVKNILIGLINEEKRSIDCAMYMFTEKSIAQAMLQAYLRGVKIRIILDPISMDEKYGKGLFLKNNGISVCVYNSCSTRTFFEPIMHHKFFIFGLNSLLQRSLVWTGSYNCTSSASRLHEENVIVTDDMSAISEYQKCFIAMLNRFDTIRYIDIETETQEGYL
ncbi:hypothetical protein HYV10_04375 [Candidatus Dependentiae bacterium]|nr:hypothetical protein [Candidatus Dependentiae bacterium]